MAHVIRIFYCLGLFFFIISTAGSYSAHGLTLNGEISCENCNPSGGSFYIFARDTDTGETMAQVEITTPGTFSLDLGGQNPKSVIVTAFHDTNNSGGNSPDFGDSLGWYSGNPLELSGLDINNIQLNLSTTFGANCGDACTYELHDEFSNPNGLINENSWSSSWGMLENYRYVSGGTLKMGARPRFGFDGQIIRVQHDEVVNKFIAHVKINDYSIKPNSQDQAFARINAYLYNSEAALPTGPRGDLRASLYFGDWGGGLEIGWQIFRINDNNWEEWELLSQGLIPVTGGLELENWYAWEIDISQPENQVVFNFYDNAGVLLAFQAINNLPVKKGDAYTRDPDVRVYVEDLENGTQDPKYVFAEFDNIWINGTLYDDFSTNHLDPARWSSNEAVSRIENDHLILMANARGARETIQLQTQQFFPHTAVDVTIDSNSHVFSGAKGQFRLEGALYNAEKGPGSGEDYLGDQGLVWAKVFIDRLDDDTLRAGYYIDRSKIPDPVNDEDWEVLASGIFSGITIQADREYRLSLNFTGREVVFKCKDLTATPVTEVEFIYPITTPAFPCKQPHSALTSRVYAGTGQSGYMIARCSAFYTGEITDGDLDGIMDFFEIMHLSNPLDADMDDDGILDGNEDRNHDGVVDEGETNPNNRDTDDDGLLDGMETGLTAPENPAHTNMAIFVPDTHEDSVTDPTNPDSDRDGIFDGQEDANHNGNVDVGETDPNKGISVSGRVTDISGNPISGLWVHAFETPCTDTWLGGDNTDVNGYYSITDLPAGNVHVEACASCNDMGSGYANEWWAGIGNDGVSDCQDAQALVMQADQDRNDIHFQLEPAGSISGTITDLNGNPIQGLHVQIKAEQCNWENQWAGVNTDENGYFQAKGIPVGNVYVYACPECSNDIGLNYVGQWFGGNKNCETAVAVEITQGQETSLPDFLLEPGHTVSGSVTDGENGIQGLWISVQDWETNEYLGGATTDENGNYTVIGLPHASSYRVYLNSGNSDYIGENYDTPVLPEDSGVDFTPDRGVKIYGTISGEDQGLSNVCVNAFNEKCGDMSFGSGTDHLGNYTIVVPPGSYYLQANPECNNNLNYVITWWNNSGGSVDCDLAEAVVVTEESNTEINLTLTPKLLIFGNIKQNETDLPVEDATIEILTPNGESMATATSD